MRGSRFSFYRTLKLVLPGGISYDGTIKTGMGVGSMGEVVGVLTPTIFKDEIQPKGKCLSMALLRTEIGASQSETCSRCYASRSVYLLFARNPSDCQVLSGYSVKSLTSTQFILINVPEVFLG